ncbi:MAG: ABC transporter ATP-binding protein [Pseudomonadota bacterium]
MGPRGILWRLVSESFPTYWRGYGVAVALMVVVAGMTGLTAWIMRDVINELFVDRNREAIQLIAFSIFVIFMVKGIAAYGQMVILRCIGNAIIADVQRRMFDQVLAQRIDFFDSFSLGDLATRLSKNAQSARDALTLMVTRLGGDAMTLVALITVMVIQNPMMSLIALLVAPPAILGVTALLRKVKAVAKKEFISQTRIVSTVQEAALGARVVKAFGLEGHMRDQMGGAIDDVRRRADRLAMIQAAPMPLMEGLAGVMIGSVVLFAGWKVVEGETDPGAFFSFLTALLLAYDPARRLAQLSVLLRTHLVGVELMYQLLDQAPRIKAAPDAKPLALRDGEIRLEGVHFRYAGRTDTDLDAAPSEEAPAKAPPALNDLTLTAPAGKVTAIVGPSGAGKSTLFALIERFYDPDQGRVLIDGHDLAGVTFDSLRGALSHVSQDSFLFDGTVAENIRMGRLDATDDEVRAAAEAANAAGFIAALPKGYDTPLGENGARLSGGQRQRLAIARAMLRRAPILLLDEPTSALDAETEARVAEALGRLMAGRTTLVIAHRLATVRGADKIHVLDAGRVVQSGTHDSLMAEGGLYARLSALQFSGAAAE